MESSNPALQDAGKRLLTIRQQIDKLKEWNKSQESKLTQKISPEPIQPITKNVEKKPTSPPIRKNINSITKLDDHPIVPVYSDFGSLLEAKLEESQKNENSQRPCLEKRKFLRKGEGITSRYPMKPIKLKKSTSKLSKSNEDSQLTLHQPLFKEKVKSLEAFETLEQKAHDSSFCSTSSMVEELMEESIKSTPIKNDLPADKYSFFYESENGSNLNMMNDEYFSTRTLGVIDEEPSRLEESYRNQSESSECNFIVFNQNQNITEYGEEDQSEEECGSECSCQQNQFMSASLSVYEETTTVYSPVKSTMQARLKELEIEIDAFRSENSHLSKLRSEYEEEYNKFCKEKTEILSKIREEHLTGLRELEEEKKKLQREKFAFEKYIKETKSRPSKEEKEEIRLLKEEIKKLKDDMNRKESRWAAAQARIRTEMKQLKDHNIQLKEEVEKLRKSSKNVSFAPLVKKSKSSSNILSRIDGELEKLKISSEKVKTSPISEDLNNTSGYNSDKSTESPECSTQEDKSEAIEIYDNSGNREKMYPDGRKEIWYPNGNVKKISKDGKITKTIYYNGDVKEIHNETKTVKYYYAESKIWHSEFEDGSEIMEFSNGQVEKRSKDGSVQINYPTGVVYTVDSNGNKKWINPDGSVITQNQGSGDKIIYMTNGQIETHTSEYKKREYPDGTVRIVYMDGIHETRYPNGRVRLKTKDGRLLSDSEITS